MNFRPPSTWLPWTAAIALVALAACGGDDDDQDPTGAGGASTTTTSTTTSTTTTTTSTSSTGGSGGTGGSEVGGSGPGGSGPGGSGGGGGEPGCGDGVVDANEDCDGANLDGATCADVGSFAGGTLACDSRCSFDTSGCQSAADLIATARATADGDGLSLPIAEALVTYVKPALGADPAGIFIQVEPTGPALFVAIPAETLASGLAVGDEVSFTITEMGTRAGLREVVALTGFSVDATGADVTGLIQDISAETMLVADLDDFDSELVAFLATVIDDFGAAGSPAVAANVATAGYPTGDTGLRFRLDEALRDQLDLANGCEIQVTGTPLWRFNATAQLSAFDATEVTVVSCNAPRVLSATATSDTEVVVSFDRFIDPGTVDPGDFTFDGGLTATGAVVSGRDVTVTTSAQTPAQSYTVTVAGLTDTLGTDVDAAFDEAQFNGFGTPELVCDDRLDDDGDGAIDCLDSDCASDPACAFAPQLYLWEVDADTPGNDEQEFIEIWNNTGASFDFDSAPTFVVLINGANDLVYGALKLAGQVADDGVFVLGNPLVPNVDQVFANNFLQNGQDGVLLVSCPTCPDATDFPNNFDVGTTLTFTSANGHTATKIDALAYDTNDPDDLDLMAKLGVTEQFNEDDGLGGMVNDANQRTSLTRWFALTPTPGVR